MARGGFFTVDRGAWRAAMALGLDAGVSYLVMARHAQGQKRHTGASALAVANRTRIYRQRATIAIDAMMAAGVVRRDRSGSRPLYFLPKVDMPGPSAPRARPLALPNELADLGDGRRAPLDLIHDAADPVAALRLLLDLYEARDPEEYGVRVHQLAAVAPRQLAAELEHHVVWYFGAPREPTSWDGSFTGVGPALHELERLGLVESRLYMTDGLDENAIAWHSCEPDGIGAKAHAAGLRLLPPAKRAEAEGLFLLPVARRSITTEAYLVRLYRPRFDLGLSTEAFVDDSEAHGVDFDDMAPVRDALPPRPPGPAIVVPPKSSKRSRRRDRARH